MILISYRHADSAAYAEALYDRLRARYGDVVLGGTERAGSAGVVIVVIGRRWLVDDEGRRRLDDPEDRVRLEIAAALAREALVIPVLVEGATMPEAHELPTALAGLARRHALGLDDPHVDVGRLVRALDRALAAPVSEVTGPAAGQPAAATIPVQSAADLLEIQLLNAAHAGIVPTTGPRAAAPAPTEMIWAAKPLGGRGSWLLRVAVPLALLGGALAAMKWLLGWFAVEPTEAVPDPVECTVFAPPIAAPGDAILVQVFVHLPEHAAHARAIATELDTAAVRRTFRSLESPVEPGSRLGFELRMPGLEVDEPVASLVWRRRPEAVQFGVRIPRRARGTVIGTLEVTLDSAPVGHVKFKLVVGRSTAKVSSEPQGEQARRYTAAFISYASKDRAQVLERVQMLSTVGIGYFQDLLSIEPGDRWKRKLELGIDECDLFLLFWSSEAKRSRWVRREVRHALARQGGDELAPPEIRPVILEGPPIVAPWRELRHLHFNDPLLYFMRPP